MGDVDRQRQRSRTDMIVNAVARKLLSDRLVVNHIRGAVAEAIVEQALAPDWHWCSEDWGGWDFSRDDGLKLEVKQSAALQTWSGPDAKPSRASFDIAARKGRFAEQSAWIDGPGRWADLYVFAHHARVDVDADHRDPEQWLFYVVPTHHLPDAKQIALSGIQAISTGCTVSQLRDVVERISSQLPRKIVDNRR